MTASSLGSDCRRMYTTCPLCALVGLKGLQARGEANQTGRPGAIPRVHLDAWRAALRINREAMHFLANDLHHRGAIVRENGYARLVEPDRSQDQTTGVTPCP